MGKTGAVRVGSNQRALLFKSPLSADELARILTVHRLFLKPCGSTHAELQLLVKLHHEIDYQAVREAGLQAGMKLPNGGLPNWKLFVSCGKSCFVGQSA